MDGETTLVGVMGWPIAHSLSPVMHNAAFAALGLNWAYVPVPVRPGEVGAAVAGLRALGFRGCNVTVPHKEAVIPHLDRLPTHVARFGAVNTLIFDRDEEGACTLTGENTDVQGFVRALRQEGFDPTGRAVAHAAVSHSRPSGDSWPSMVSPRSQPPGPANRARSRMSSASFTSRSFVAGPVRRQGPCA